MAVAHTPKLATTTRELLRTRQRIISYKKIFEDTELSVSWLTDFANNTDRDFGCDKVETLYVYLTNTSLKLEA